MLSIDAAAANDRGPRINYAGDLNILGRPAIAVIGARDASEDGKHRSYQLGKQLASRGITVVSGLAAGIDRNALEGAIQAGGKVAAVIGTPIDTAYPAANKRLQELIAANHLLVSQFPNGSRVFPSNFPARNRTMAALTDASVIIEASESSGTLHQAAECKRLGRWLVIAKNMLDNHRAEWPKKFLSYEKCHVLVNTDKLLEAVYGI
ncbi:DNA processing protein DprA [Paracoccus onubensis]|uniref:DNA processing protein DprA n=2 Tax=Paracoccus onubensis TaxID=1675788 RepID=A0A418T4Z1_9RHOB|nr:DNA processing protein DprA [Paracoccus onubensis]